VVGCHEMRGPEPHRQRQLRPVHHRPGRDRRLALAGQEIDTSELPSLEALRVTSETLGAAEGHYRCKVLLGTAQSL
jgi:hypothetical protein